METNVKFQLAHVGIHQQNAQEAQEVCEHLCELFGFSSKSGSSSYFAGDDIEIMKSQFLNVKGHIAIGTNDIIAARALLERKGIRFLEETAKFDAENRLKAIYLEAEIGGFAFHLLQL